MRKIIMLNRISIDGYFAGPNGESHEWFVTDPKVDKASRKIVGDADTVLFGRITYQIFENHWPKVASDPKSPKEERTVANELNEMTKIVFSKTLTGVTWENSKLIKGDLVEEVKKLRQEDGSGMLIFGSGTIIQQLTDKRLIDEYLFVLTPAILGAGKQLFKDVRKFNLKLLDAKCFNSGNVLIHMRPAD